MSRYFQGRTLGLPLLFQYHAAKSSRIHTIQRIGPHQLGHTQCSHSVERCQIGQRVSGQMRVQIDRKAIRGVFSASLHQNGLVRLVQPFETHHLVAF